jgi:hypothetical protein
MTNKSNVFETKFKVSKYNAPAYDVVNTGLKEDVNGLFKEALTSDPKYGKVIKEKLTLKEAGQTTATNTGAYVNMLQQIIHHAMIEDKELKTAEELVFVNTDMVKASGYGAYQIPRMEPTIALEIAEGAVVNYFEEGVEPIVVVPKKYVASTKITWEIRKRGMGSLMNYILGNAKDALVRKRISNIVNGLAAGAGTTVSGGLSYANFLAARKEVRDASSNNGSKYNFFPNWFVVSSEYYNDVVLDESFQKAMFPGNANNNVARNELGILAPMRVLECTIWETPMLTGAQALVLDSKKAGMLCKEAEYEMFEGRLPGSPDTEILALMSEVLAMVFPKACVKLTA